VLLATYELGDALLTTLAIFFFVIWIWVVIAIIMDIFRDHAMGGAVKALWILALFIIPPFAALIYLIFRGSGMRERAIKDQQEHAVGRLVLLHDSVCRLCDSGCARRQSEVLPDHAEGGDQLGLCHDIEGPSLVHLKVDVAVGLDSPTEP